MSRRDGNLACFRHVYGVLIVFRSPSSESCQSSTNIPTHYALRHTSGALEPARQPGTQDASAPATFRFTSHVTHTTESLIIHRTVERTL